MAKRKTFKDLGEQYKLVDEEYEKAKAKREEIRTEIRNKLEALEVESVRIANYNFTMAKESVTEKFDKNKFKKDYPNIFPEYVSLGKKESYLKVTKK